MNAAATGADALRYVKELRPDLVLLNIDLAGPLSAFDLVVACRAGGPVAFSDTPPRSSWGR